MARLVVSSDVIKCSDSTSIVMKTLWTQLALHLQLISLWISTAFGATVYLPPYGYNNDFENISNYHDFAKLLLKHQDAKEQAYQFAKAKGWIRFPQKMKKELTELNYTAYPFLDELLKFHPDIHENDKNQKKYYYMNERKSGNRRALRQFKLRYNRMMYSILPTEAGRTKKLVDMSGEIRNPVKFMKENLIKMDRAIDYIDIQVLKEKMSTPKDFVQMKERAEGIRKRIFAIENNGTEHYSPKPTMILKPKRITVRPIKGKVLAELRAAFPNWFVDVTTPSSLEVATRAKSHEDI